MVFCGECKYFVKWKQYAQCDFSGNTTIKYNWEQKWHSHTHKPEHINKNNTCKWFERK